MKWCRWAFYTLAFCNVAMAEYVRWFEGNRSESGYWLAHAIVDFLIGYIIFNPPSAAPQPTKEGK